MSKVKPQPSALQQKEPVSKQPSRASLAPAQVRSPSKPELKPQAKKELNNGQFDVMKPAQAQKPAFISGAIRRSAAESQPVSKDDLKKAAPVAAQNAAVLYKRSDSRGSALGAAGREVLGGRRNSAAGRRDSISGLSKPSGVQGVQIKTPQQPDKPKAPQPPVFVQHKSSAIHKVQPPKS